MEAKMQKFMQKLQINITVEIVGTTISGVGSIEENISLNEEKLLQ